MPLESNAKPLITLGSFIGNTVKGKAITLYILGIPISSENSEYSVFKSYMDSFSPKESWFL